MMKRNWLGCAALLFLLSWPIGSAAASPALRPDIPGHIKVSAEHISISDKYARMDAAYPVIAGLKDTVFEADLNRFFQLDMENRVNQMKDDAVAEYKSMRAAGYPYNGFELSSTVTTSRNDGTLLCFSIRMELYTNGAHPFSESEFYTVLNTVPAKRLVLLDLFTDKAKGKGRLEKLVQEEFAKNPGDYFDHPQFTVDDKTWFYLTDKELHIVFPAYSVACGAAGEPELGFDLGLFKDVLIPEVQS